MLAFALALSVALLIAAPSPAEAAKRGPVDATVAVDKGRATSKLITRAGGGTVSVRARNGTKVIVKFPAGAVPADTTVTAVPVTKLGSRLTRRGLLAGVQLGPEGLQLRKPATVKFVRNKRAAKGTRLVFVGSEGDGDDIHRLPPPMRRKGRRYVPTGRPVVSISHFSTVDGFDWSKATVSQINTILYPAVGVHALSQEMSKLFEDKNTTQADIAEAYERARKRFVDPVREQALAALRSTCSVKALRSAKAAIALTLGLDRQLQLLGYDTGTVPAAELLSEAANCAVKLCPTLGDPTAAIFLARISRDMQLLGAGSNAFHAALFENLLRCGIFEVRLDARIDLGSEFGGFSHRVTGVVRVVPSFPPSVDGFSPRGPLEYQATSGSITHECEHITISSTTNGMFQVTNYSFHSFDPDKPTQDPVLSLELAIIGFPSETWHTQVMAPCTYTQEDVTVGNWFSGFHTLHPDFTFAGTDFQPDEPPVFAIATYGPSTTPYTWYSEGTLSENTKVEIVHTPEPPKPMPEPGTPD